MEYIYFLLKFEKLSSWKSLHPSYSVPTTMTECVLLYIKLQKFINTYAAFSLNERGLALWAVVYIVLQTVMWLLRSTFQKQNKKEKYIVLKTWALKAKKKQKTKSKKNSLQLELSLSLLSVYKIWDHFKFKRSKKAKFSLLFKFWQSTHAKLTFKAALAMDILFWQRYNMHTPHSSYCCGFPPHPSSSQHQLLSAKLQRRHKS